MSTSILKVETPKSVQADPPDSAGPKEKTGWETPTIKDVSENVMAQPYIRFT